MPKGGGIKSVARAAPLRQRGGAGLYQSMLFNSYEFLFIFFPISLAVYFLCRRFAGRLEYQPFFGEMLGVLGGAGRPLLIFIQTRMMPYGIRSRYPRAFHQYLKPLADEVVSELLTFSFNEMGIEFTEKQIADVTSLLD